MKKILSFAALASASILTGGADAAVTAYTNKAAFLAAAGSTQTETFSSATPGRFSTSGANGAFSQSFDGFTLTGQSNGNFVGVTSSEQSSSGPNNAIPATFTGQNYLTWADGYYGTRTADIVTINIDLNAATTAFGFDWFNTDATDQYTFTVDGQAFSAPPFTVANQGIATSGFFGLISDTAFRQATITNNFFGGYISDEGFDNLITNGVGSSNPGAVPEPASWALMIIGFGGVGSAMRRSRRTVVKFA